METEREANDTLARWKQRHGARRFEEQSIRGRRVESSFEEVDAEEDADRYSAWSGPSSAAGFYMQAQLVGHGLREPWRPRPALGSQLLSRLSVRHSSNGLQTHKFVDLEASTRSAFDKLIDRVQARGMNLRVTIACRNLSSTVDCVNSAGHAVERPMLHPFNGVIRAGSLVALMGPGSEGRAALLNILANRSVTPFRGRVLVNGHDRDARLFRRISSYMPRVEYLCGLETVYESVRFVAVMKSNTLQSLREDAATNSSDVDPVLAILAELGLVKVADVPIGNDLVHGVSASQARRAALARAVVSIPSLLFADEPTEGLSALEADVMLEMMKKMTTKLGITCVVSTGQARPGDFARFDHLVLLAGGGHVVYNAPAAGIAAYVASMGFAPPSETHSVSDFVVEALRRSPKAFRERYAEREAGVALEDARNAAEREKGLSEAGIIAQSGQPVRQYHAGKLRQAAFVLGRTFKLLGRNPNALTVAIVHKLFAGVALGVVYFGVAMRPDQIPVQLGFLLVLLLAAAAGAVQNVGDHADARYTMEMEVAEALFSPLAFVLAQFARCLVLAFVGTAALVFTAYYMAGFSGHAGLVLGLEVFLFIAALDSMVSFIVALADGVQNATSFSVVVLCVLGLFNGLTANRTSSPDFISFLAYVSPFFWTFAASVNLVFEDADFSQTTAFADYQDLLANLGLPARFEATTLGINSAIAVYFRVLQYAALRSRTAPRN